MLMNVNVTVKSVSEPSRFAKAGRPPSPAPQQPPHPCLHPRARGFMGALPEGMEHGLVETFRVVDYRR